MVCNHLKELYQLCESNQLRIGGSDLVRVVCRQCDEEETCPSVLMEHYDTNESDRQPGENAADSAPSDSKS